MSPTNDGKAGGRFSALRWLIWLLILPFLWIIFQRLDLPKLLAVLANLSRLEIGLILMINCAVLLSLSSRWWLILYGNGWRLSYWKVSAYRLAGFSVSYFTPGPQFGGEPLLVQLLRRRHGLPGKSAGATVALDKSIELAVNFGFLVFGVLLALLLGLVPSKNSWLLLLAALGLLLLPLTHLIVASRGQRPLAAILSNLPQRWRNKPWLKKSIELIAEMESQLAGYLTKRPRWVGLALIASLFSWFLLIGEYWMMGRFLDLGINVWMAIAALTAARLAILLPSPAGLGTLEVSQVLAFSALTQSPEAGAALALVIRARDIIFGAIGLVLVGYFGGAITPATTTLAGAHRHPVDEQDK